MRGLFFPPFSKEPALQPSAVGGQPNRRNLCHPTPNQIKPVPIFCGGEVLDFCSSLPRFFFAPLTLADDPDPDLPRPDVPLMSPLEAVDFGPWVVRAEFDDSAQVAELARWAEPWEVNHAEQYLIVEVLDPAEYTRLQNLGFRLAVDEKLTALYRQPNQRLPNQASGIPGYPCYRTVEETFATAESLVSQHPSLAEWLDVGDSWEKTQNPSNGYDLMVLKLTNQAIPGDKPKLFATTAIHAREYTTAELATRFAEYLLAQYGRNADVTWLFDYHEIHLMLQANPDGRKQAEAGLSWRKNTNTAYCSPTSNSRGADLNRNFEFRWGCCNGSSPSECDFTYRGPSPASEPETQAVQNYLRQLYPDLRADPLDSPAPITTTGIYLDIHSYSELVLWSWGFTSDVAPNGPALQTLGRRLAYFNGYEPDQAIGLYPTDGTTDDFGYGALGVPSFTYELGTSFFQDCNTFENTILPDNLDSLLYAAKVLRAPYLLPSGPEAVNLSLSSPLVDAGTAVTLTLTLDDTRFENQNGAEPTQAISQAMVYLNTPPWLTGTIITGQMVQAVDGNFDTATETAFAVIDTTALAPGQHTLFVQAQDASGSLGPVSAVFLNIIEPGVTPNLAGTVRSALNGQPLTATVTAGVFQTATDSLSGSYQLPVISDTYSVQATAPGYLPHTEPGVPVPNGQTVVQNFELYPDWLVCAPVSNDFEAGPAGWTATGSWAITNEAAHSPTRAWSDSPGGNYANNVNAAVTSPGFDVGQWDSVTLSFWNRYRLEVGYDYGYVEYSTDNGATWNQAHSVNGYQMTWQKVEVALPVAGASQLQIRFRIETDTWQTDDGWYVDDVALETGGAFCLTYLAPVADFQVDEPAIAGLPTQFSDLSTGPIVTHTWQFGDGGSSSAASPVYTYSTPGVYSVSLTVAGDTGQDTLTQSLLVESPSYTVSLTSPLSEQTGRPGESLTYSLNLSNGGNVSDAYALQMQSQAWPAALSLTETARLAPGEDVTAQVSVSLPPTVTLADRNTLTVTVSSLAQPSVQAQQIFHSEVCFPPQILGLQASSPVTVGQTISFTPTVTGTAPLSYSWDFGGAATQTGSLTAPSVIYHLPGQYTATLTVSNTCPAQATASLSVTVRATITPLLAVQSPVLSVSLTSGVSPLTATQSLTIHNISQRSVGWQADLSPSVSWVALAPLTGTGTLPLPISGILTALSQQNLALWFDGVGLEPGVYTTSLRVENLSGSQASLTRPMTLTVLSPPPPITAPAIAVSPSTISLTLTATQRLTTALSLSNVGEGQLAWGPLEALPPVSWLTLGETSGTLTPAESPITIPLTLDSPSLAAQVYTTTLRLPSNDALTPLVTVPVRLQVLPAVVVGEVERVYLPLVLK